MKKQKTNFRAVARALEAMNTSHDPRVTDFIGLFDEMATLTEEMEKATSSDEVQILSQKMEECHSIIRGRIEESCRAQGLTMDEARGYLTNSKNFDQKGWEEVHSMLRRLEDAANERLEYASIL